MQRALLSRFPAVRGGNGGHQGLRITRGRRRRGPADTYPHLAVERAEFDLPDVMGGIRPASRWCASRGRVHTEKPCRSCRQVIVSTPAKRTGTVSSVKSLRRTEVSAPVMRPKEAIERLQALMRGASFVLEADATRHHARSPPEG